MPDPGLPPIPVRAGEAGQALYRVIPHLGGASPDQDGGTRYVPRERQGAGRHDNPDLYGALYLSRSPEGAVAESIQAFRGQELAAGDLLRPGGRVLALVAYEWRGELVDLDEPRELVRRDLRPSRVATRRRAATREIARSLFEEGRAGLSWWSTLEATWIHCTLFAERALPDLEVIGPAETLALSHPALRAAAEEIGVRLARR